MKLRTRTRHRSARIEIIPLIDIMFFLLATFVMVSTAMIKNKGIPVHLPSAETGASADRKDYVSLSIAKSGEYFLDRQPVGLPELEARLIELKQSVNDPKVFINGDSEADLQRLVSALDIVRKIGIAKVALETKEQ